MNSAAPLRVPFEPLPHALSLPGLTPAAEIPALRQYWRILLRWRYVIGGAVAGCLLAGMVVTLLMTPKYTAQTTIEIARESNRITDIQGVQRDANVQDQEFYQTQYGLLRSQTLAERVAQHLRLVDDPNFYKRFSYRSKRPEFDLSVGRYPANGRVARQRAAGEILLKNLNVAPTRLSRLVDVAFTSPDPDFSTNVANAWAADFIQITMERRYQATSYARTFLENRLEGLRQKLEESERRLVGYAAAQSIVNLPASVAADGTRVPERSIAADDLVALNGALAQATADRVAAQARYEEQGGKGESVEALRNIAINGLRQRRAELSADYQRLMVQFEPDYPQAKALAAQIGQLDRSIAREEGRVVGSVESDYRAAKDREERLKTQVDKLKHGLLDLRRRSIQYNIFQRDVDTNRSLYDGLLQRYKEIGVAGGVGVNNVSVVDLAERPIKPSSPRVVLNLLLALIAGLGLGGMLAFALEQVDEVISDPADMQRDLGLPLLGAIPRVMDRGPTEALLDRKSELVDAYLSVQTNLQFTTENGVPRSIAVTSTRPTEGKSTTALSLATVLARTHKNVILVDGDMRSPSVHHLLELPHDEGLSNYLAGDDTVAPLLHRVERLGLTVMTAGPTPPNAAELLTGDRLGKLVEILLDKFDHVVVDSPPVMGLADAPLIASRMEGAVYVVESHGIRTSLVRTALARLASSNVRLLGGIVTKFDNKRAHFGHGYEYGYGYGRDARHATKAGGKR